MELSDLERRLEPYGAERWQPVATGGKWAGAENGSDRTHSMSCSTDRAMIDEIGAAVRSYRTTTKPTRRDLRP
jgi:hypothetical protein